MSPANALRFWPQSDALAGLREEVEKLPSNDHVFAEAIGQGPVVLGFIATPQGGSTPQIESGLRPWRRRSGTVRAVLSRRRRKPARAARQGVRRRLAQLAARARSDHPPHAHGGAGRRQALPFLRRRHAAACARRLDLCGQILGRERREGVRREDGHRRGPHRRLRGSDRGRRPDVDQVHQTGQGALSAGLESAERRYRQGRYRRPSRHHRHERGRPARSPRHAARSLGAGRRAARSGHRADPARLLPAAA